jgi:hypothetical protein
LTGLCDMRVDEILYGDIHNAVATAQDGFTLLVNHDYGLELALTAGYRSMELDIGRCNGNIVFFHAQCLLGTRSIVTVLSNINTFLNDNPTQVNMAVRLL